MPVFDQVPPRRTVPRPETREVAVDSSDVVSAAAGSPLGKPPGTVRAYLAVAIVASFLVAHVGGALVLLRAGALDAALGLLGALALEAAMVTGFYFGARQGNG
jgi:hypothetical protein